MTTRTSKQHGWGGASRGRHPRRARPRQCNRIGRPSKGTRRRRAAAAQQVTQQGTQQFVTFIAGDEVFAADMAPVKEIIRVPEVVRVPLAPAALEGLANLRGKVLPIISLRRLFGFPELPHDDSTRALVVDVGQPLGFVVDRVSSVVGVDASHIEDVGSIRTTVNTEVLSGLIKDVGGHAMIMVLDFAKLIEREFSQIASISKNTGVAGAAQASVQMRKRTRATNCNWSASMSMVRSTPSPSRTCRRSCRCRRRSFMCRMRSRTCSGVMTLRNRLLPLVSLRRMFGLPHRDLDEKSRIVVLTLGGVSVGVVVDAVSEVLRVSKSGVDALPAHAGPRRQSGRGHVDCRLDNGKRLVSIVTARNLFGHSVIKEALSTVNDSELENERKTQRSWTTTWTTTNKWSSSAWTRRSSVRRLPACRRLSACRSN